MHFIAANAAFARLAGRRCQAGLGKGNTTAAANSFQAREGATGVIGHNLVDSLIYKQSLMKFLVFINNALQPRAPVCRHRYSGIPFSPSPSPPLLATPFIPFHFPAHTPVPSLPCVPPSNTLYRPGFQPTPLPLAAAGVSWMNQRVNTFLSLSPVVIRFSVDYIN